MNARLAITVANASARPSMIRALAAIAIRWRVRRADARDRAERAAMDQSERREPPRARGLDLTSFIKPFGD